MRILSLVGKDLDTYPIEGTEVPVGFEFKQYGLGGISSVPTKRTSPAQLLVEWPDPSSRLFSTTPANATLTFIFNIAPEDLIVSQHRVVTDGNVVKETNTKLPFLFRMENRLSRKLLML